MHVTIEVGSNLAGVLFALVIGLSITLISRGR